jgi:hypothetical protein
MPQRWKRRRCGLSLVIKQGKDECDKTKKRGRGNITGAAALTMLGRCSTHIKCYKKHAVLAQMEHVWMKVYRGQRVMGRG